jgi:hypothetical protein
MQKFKEIHIKAIKLIKSGMSEHKIAETLGKSRCWVQTVKRAPGYQEMLDNVDISDISDILNPPIEPLFEAIVEDIAKEILNPDPEPIIKALQHPKPIQEEISSPTPEPVIKALPPTEPIYRGDVSISSERLERLGQLTHYQKVSLLRQETEDLGLIMLKTCQGLASIAQERARTITSEEISAKNLPILLKSIIEVSNKSIEVLSASLGIEKLQEVLAAELEIKEEELLELDFADV